MRAGRTIPTIRRREYVRAAGVGAYAGGPRKSSMYPAPLRRTELAGRRLQRRNSPSEISSGRKRRRPSAAAAVPARRLRQAARFGYRKQIATDVRESNRTEFEDDLLTIRGVARFDINVHDVGNASADEDGREAGPVVGLITKAA